MKNFTPVSKAHPCPVCDHPDWCRVFDDGGVECMRVPKGKQCKSGGWMHKEKPIDTTPIIRVPKVDDTKLTHAQVDEKLAKYRAAVTPAMLDAHSVSLGLPVEVIKRLNPGFHTHAARWVEEEHRTQHCPAWAYPMCNPDGQAIGIRLRSDDGNKWTVKGSRSGLFIPSGLTGRGPLLIHEGPTDLAAMLTLGYDGIGRAACSGQVDMVIEFLQSGPRRDVVVMADKDEAKKRPDGSLWYPGQEGAIRMADEIKPFTRTLKVIYPLVGKDARKWVHAGATRALVDSVIRAARFHVIKAGKEAANG
jgi:phage/plasmid primase-like uncharacterized protein